MMFELEHSYYLVFVGGNVLMYKENRPDVKFAALLLIKTAYEKGLIDKKTYQTVIKKYGGAYCGK